jgi:hypothetical protein
MKTTTALLRRGVKEGELAENVKGIHGKSPVSADTCRSLRTVLNSYVRYLCSQKPKEGETSLWIDALASYL